MYSLQQYLSFAETIIKKMGPSSLLTDENISHVAQSAMIRESKFDETRGMSKKKYIILMMTYAVKKLRYLHRQNKDISNCQEFLEFSNSGINPEQEAIQRDIIDVLSKKLSKLHYLAIHRYFLDGMTLQEIADEDGCTRENVRQLVNIGLQKARELVC